MAAAREEQFGLKVLGAFVGSSRYVQLNVVSKIPKFRHIADVLIHFPNQQGRFLLHSFSFNSRVNYSLRTQYPEHSKPLVGGVKHMQMDLTDSYHGNSCQGDEAKIQYAWDRSSRPIRDGGMSLADVESAHLAAFPASMVACTPYLAKVFPSWASMDGNGKIVSISEERDPYIANQIMEAVDVINQRAPNGPLQGLDSLTVFLN